jgi:hypothetical protein
MLNIIMLSVLRLIVGILYSGLDTAATLSMMTLVITALSIMSLFATLSIHDTAK